jgi:tetratricopeptide (TPR) repeat protein
MLAQLRNENKHAAEAFREALAIDPEHHGSEAALNQLKAAAGDAKIADELLAKIDRATDWRSLQRIAESFFAAGDYASSKAIFDEALLALSKADDTNAATRSEVATALSARRADAHYELGAVRAAAMGEGFADTVRDLPVEQMLLKLDEIMRRIHGDTVKVSWGLHDGKAHVSMSQRACEHLHALADLPLVGVNVGKSGVRDLGPVAGLPPRSLTWNQSLAPRSGP